MKKLLVFALAIIGLSAQAAVDPAFPDKLRLSYECMSENGYESLQLSFENTPWNDRKTLVKLMQNEASTSAWWSVASVNLESFQKTEGKATFTLEAAHIEKTYTEVEMVGDLKRPGSLVISAKNYYFDPAGTKMDCKFSR